MRLRFTQIIVGVSLGLMAMPENASAQACQELCAPKDDCWDPVLQKDTCVDPPDVCVPPPPGSFTFEADGGQIVALNKPDETVGCGTVTVKTTGYYSIFDIDLSESCDTQKDETGYLTITNTCNSAGWPVERNAGDRFVVPDGDNERCIDNNTACASEGKVCKESKRDGFCCVSSEPVFMGTFFLDANQPNRICLHHWCPDWEENKELGFVTNDCGGPNKVNSIHFVLEGDELACQEQRTLQECTWGCGDNGCVPDPCLDAGCENYCKDGVCMDESPCEDMGCTYGCLNGYCLQAPNSRGGDGDGDGYSKLGDCNDDNGQVNSGQNEICGNNIDDNCNGTKDEDTCVELKKADKEDEVEGDGEGCSASLDGRPWGGQLTLALLVVVLMFGRRVGRFLHGLLTI